jgi:hypothetical protein
MRRVLKPGGRVAVASFVAGPKDPAKQAVEAVAASFGYQEPAWYTHLKAFEARAGEANNLRRAAQLAGFEHVHTDSLEVDTGLDSPEAFVDYRLGMPNLALLVTSLQERRRQELWRAAVDSIAGWYQPLRPRVLILSSRAPA